MPFLIPLFIGVIFYFGIALALIASQPLARQFKNKSINFSNLGNTPSPQLPQHQYVARDGANLSYRRFIAQTPNSTLLILIHGSGWHGSGYLQLAAKIAKDHDIEVVVPDLRGHGPSPQTRGDLSYIGQFEDDLADLVAHMRQNNLKRRIIFAGHSSGGRLVVRFAGGKYGALLDGAVLIAPFLKYNAPTMRQNAGGWAHALTRRIIGLSMLNLVGLRMFNGIPVVQFNFPREVLERPSGKTATTAYSYRLNASYAPRNNYLADIAALPKFIVLAGRQDEAFIAEAYEHLFTEVTDMGHYFLLEGETHLSIINAEKTSDHIHDFVKSFETNRL